MGNSCINSEAVDVHPQQAHRVWSLSTCTSEFTDSSQDDENRDCELTKGSMS